MIDAFPSFNHVLGDARLRDLKPELEQFAVDAWRPCVYRKPNPGVAVMESAQDRKQCDAPDPLRPGLGFRYSQGPGKTPGAIAEALGVSRMSVGRALNGRAEHQTRRVGGSGQT